MLIIQRLVFYQIDHQTFFGISLWATNDKILVIFSIIHHIANYLLIFLVLVFASMWIQFY